jgi:hypothetical protein
MVRVHIPSWVAFSDDDSVLVGEAAKNHADTHPEAAIFGFKRMLSQRYKEDTVQRLIQRVPYKIGPTRYSIGSVILLKYDPNSNVSLAGTPGGLRFGLCLLADLFPYLTAVSLSYKYIL